MMTFLAALILVGTLAKPVCPPKPVQRYSKGCPYCCCGVVNDGTSTVKQMLEACEKTQDKMCRDMCSEAAKKSGVKVR